MNRYSSEVVYNSNANYTIPIIIRFVNIITDNTQVSRIFPPRSDEGSECEYDLAYVTRRGCPTPKQFQGRLFRI